MNIKYAEWKKCRVAPDYHVEIADHYFSDLAPWSIRTPLLSHRFSRIKLHPLRARLEGLPWSAPGCC